MEFRKHESQRTNVQQIFQQILENGPISRRELQQLTGFSWGLISQVTTRLLAEGYLVTEDDSTAAGVGRRAEKIDIIGTDRFSIGVDIHHDGMYAVVVDMKGRVIESNRYLWIRQERESVLQQLYGVLDTLVERYADKHITSIGVAVQGITDMQQGVSAYIRKIKNWENVPLGDLLRCRYDVDVAVVHDPDCLMEYEYANGILKKTNARDVLLVHYNSAAHSLGMSVMIGGQIYVGHRGRAAEIGYTVVGEKPDGTPELLVDQMLDPCVMPEKLCNSIGKATAIANTMYNPQYVVLHIMECGCRDMMIGAIKHWIHSSSYDASVSVKISQSGPDATARGAAMIMVESAIDELL